MTNIESRHNYGIPAQEFPQGGEAVSSDILNAEAVLLARPVESATYIPVIEEPPEQVTRRRRQHPNSFPMPVEPTPAAMPERRFSAPSGYADRGTEIVDINKTRMIDNAPKILHHLNALPQPVAAPQLPVWVQEVNRQTGRSPAPLSVSEIDRHLGDQTPKHNPSDFRKSDGTFDDAAYLTYKRTQNL